MNEEWRDIKGYEGLYQVSNLGRVKSLPRERRNRQGYYYTKEKILKQTNTSTGYKKVELFNGTRKSYKVHRLVAQAFLNNEYNKPQVNHKDGNKINNNVNNLEWVTGSKNIIHAYKTGLNPNMKTLNDDDIIYKYTIEGLNMKEIASIYNVCINTIKKRLEDNNIEIRGLSEINNKFHLDEMDLEYELQFKTQAQLAKELGCDQSLISKKLNKKY